MVYVIGVEGDTIYKIGIASDPESRLRELQTAHHQKSRLCFAMKTYAARELEIKLHTAIDVGRANGSI
jgi:predicted GIY-YIG superfamily endonuclease